MASGQNHDSLRRGNLATVLQLVHESGSISRADVTAATGLDRSTVARIVQRLIEARMIVETAPEATSRAGRPSPILRGSDEPVVIAVNPEVDAVTVAVVGFSARIVHRVRRPVDHVISPDEAVAIILDVIDGWGEVLRHHRIVGVGLAVPGLVDSRGVVRWAPHLEWTDSDLGQLLRDVLGVPVVLDNDANLGALAELRFGVGRDVDDLIYLNGGASGIGGGVIADGRPLRGRSGFAGELGQSIGTGSARLEDVVNRVRLLAVLGLDDADELDLESALLGSRDEAVLQELALQRASLASAVSAAINVLNPSLVVLGGFLGSIYSTDPHEFERLARSQAVPLSWEGVVITRSALGPNLLLIGAAELALAAAIADQD